MVELSIDSLKLFMNPKNIKKIELSNRITILMILKLLSRKIILIKAIKSG